MRVSYRVGRFRNAWRLPAGKRERSLPDFLSAGAGKLLTGPLRASQVPVDNGELKKPIRACRDLDNQPPPAQTALKLQTADCAFRLRFVTYGG